MVTNSSPGEAGTGLWSQCSGEPGAPDVLLLHGLFGMGSNLGALARALAARFRVHQLDLPNHGRSPWQDAMTLADLAAAVRAYCAQAVEGPVAVVGHSLGGKVAMQIALEEQPRPAAIVMADIAPVDYPASHGAVFAAIDAVRQARPDSRGEAIAIMSERLEEKGVAQFLALSLVRGDAGDYRWRFNVDALKAGYDELRAAPGGADSVDLPACLVYGGDSAYVNADGLAVARQRFPALETVEIPGVGHWLHAEAPEPFNAAVLDFLKRHFAAGDGA